jgi:hypothetical protein
MPRLGRTDRARADEPAANDPAPRDLRLARADTAIARSKAVEARIRHWLALYLEREANGRVKRGGV